MVFMMIRAALLAMALVLVSDVFANDYNGDAEIGSYKRKMEELAELIPYETYQKYRDIQSMINAYRDIMEGRAMVDTNALGETKFKTWKRNADLINSLLALPKGMNEAGR